MPLANISAMPDDARLATFNFSHWQDHLEIAQAIQRTTGNPVAVYPLHPGTPDADQWQRMHQAMHNDMNLALKLPQGRDFTGGDLDQTWYNANYLEHQAARAKLGI